MVTKDIKPFTVLQKYSKDTDTVNLGSVGNVFDVSHVFQSSMSHVSFTSPLPQNQW